MEAITLQDLIMRVADARNDLVTGTTTTLPGSTTVLDTNRIETRPDHWASSEIFFLEPAYTVNGNTGVQPMKVTASVNGSLTIDHALRTSGTNATQLDYALIRLFGGGSPYRSYIYALKQALDKMGLMEDDTDDTLVTATGTYEYTIPAGLKTLHTIEVSSGTAYGPWQLRPDQWRLRPGRKLWLTRDVAVAFPWDLTLIGRSAVTLPTALGSSITCDVEEVVEYALEYLNRNSYRPSDNAKGANQQQERLRTRRNYIYPNEQEIF